MFRQQRSQRFGLFETGFAERRDIPARQIRTAELEDRQRDTAAEQRAADVPHIAADARIGQIDSRQRMFDLRRTEQRFFKQFDQSVIGVRRIQFSLNAKWSKILKNRSVVSFLPSSALQTAAAEISSIARRTGSIASLCAP